MSKVPSLNYPDVISAFERAGWAVVRQRGSQKITIPAHKPIKRSTLAKLLKDSRTPLDDFLAHLR